MESIIHLIYIHAHECEINSKINPPSKCRHFTEIQPTTERSVFTQNTNKRWQIIIHSSIVAESNCRTVERKSTRIYVNLMWLMWLRNWMTKKVALGWTQCNANNNKCQLIFLRRCQWFLLHLPFVSGTHWWLICFFCACAENENFMVND